MEDFTVRRRNRLRHHYTLTSNVLLFGYRRLSDGAKLTYQVIDSFDWGDSAGLRKGYAYPSVARLACARGVSDRTIQRHVGELVQAGLLTREERPGQTNVLYIEDVSTWETRRYAQGLEGGDKDVTPPPTVSSPKEERREERRTSLTREKPSDGIEESSSYEHIAHAIKEKLSSMKAARGADPPGKARRDHLAQEMVDVLGDPHSLGYYRRVAERYPPQVVYEALGRVKEMAREGRVRRSRGATFVDIIQRLKAQGGGRKLERYQPSTVRLGQSA